MKRLLAIASVLIAGVALVVFATGSSSDSGGYRVRAIFDSAAFVIPGMDVKIGGVVVGSISAIDLTDDKKAAVVLTIDNSNYHDFRTDAFCTIRPQSLIGERFVECEPTQPQLAGSPKKPLLSQVKSGPGEGEYLLPATNTARSVDLDLINNIMRLPFRQRFTIFLNEFGTGLAGNGAELQAALRKSNPALRQFDNVLAILASQNKTLAQLAVDGDRALAPLARERASVAGFINSSAKTASATASRSAALEENFTLLPQFLRELVPTLNSLANFSTQALPVAEDLGGAATSINTFVTGTPEFAAGGTKALTSLGDTTDAAGPALEKSLPLVKDLGSLASQAKPLSTNLSALLRSLQYESGINRFLDVVFYLAGSANGYNQYGHYVRARLVLTSCTTYATQNQLSCTANFRKDFGGVTTPALPTSGGTPSATSTAVSSAAASSAQLQTIAAKAARRTIKLPGALLPGDNGVRRGAGAAPAASKRSSAATPDAQSAQSLLDYLLGQ
jgi:ABC-type transporter Mla subunit MlaD